MIKNITIGQYYPGETVIHNLDPRSKILITFIYIITLFFINTFIPYIFMTLFLISTVKLSKVPMKLIIKGLKPLLYIISITFIINLFMTKGEKLIDFWIISISKEGAYFATIMALRLIFLVIGTSLLTLTTSPISLTDGIEKLLNPFKKIGVPAHELAMMMTIALRFIPTLLDETDKIMKAQKARGADFESGNIIKRTKSLIPILVPLFISAFRRADELAMAMEARGYRGGENRTRMKVLKLQKNDYIALILTIIILIVIIIIRYM